MSATIGTRTWRMMSFSAFVESSSGQDTRTISAPATSQRRICSTVAFTSGVGVLVIVCTVMGASPPDRKSVVQGKRGAVSVEIGGRRIINKKNNENRKRE